MTFKIPRNFFSKKDQKIVDFFDELYGLIDCYVYQVKFLLEKSEEKVLIEIYKTLESVAERKIKQGFKVRKIAYEFDANGTIPL